MDKLIAKRIRRGFLSGVLRPQGLLHSNIRDHVGRGFFESDMGVLSIVPFFLGCPQGPRDFGFYDEGRELSSWQVEFLLTHTVDDVMKAIEKGVVYDLGEYPVRARRFLYKGVHAEDYLQWIR